VLGGRFGVEPKNMATASRLIKDAVDAVVMVPHDALAAPELMTYVPWWATAIRT
jgi:hypothetical protein